MNKNPKIGLIILIIASGILIPSLFFYFSQNQSLINPIIFALNTRSSSSNEEIPDWPITINGSAVGVPITMNYSDFVIESNLSRYVNIKRKEGGVTVEDNVTYDGIPYKRIIYDIMGVVAYDNVTILASDGYSSTFQQSDIDNPKYANELFLAYKRDGQNLTDYYRPVYNVVTQNFTIEKYGESFNGIWCVRHVIAFQINS
ncbi:MAG: hypothetical protein ACFFCM_11065 [Promethearchaeota archaeon]